MTSHRTGTAHDLREHEQVIHRMRVQLQTYARDREVAQVMANTQIPEAGSRHLVLIDAENMAAASNPGARDIELLLVALRLVVPGFEATQRIVACSHHAAPIVAYGFPGARHLWRSGPDGADLALLDVLENEHVDQRFGQITICSGDGIFAESTARLATVNVDVTVIARTGRLSRQLELAASHVIKLPHPRWLRKARDAG